MTWRRHIRLSAAALLAAVLVVLAPLRAISEKPHVRKVGVSVARDRLRVTFGFRDAFTPSVTKKLSSGLTTEVLVQLTLEQQGARAPAAYWAVTVEVTYDLWEEVFIITREDPAGRRRASVKTRGQAVDLAGALVNAPVAHLRNLSAGTYRIRARIETNPVSKEMVEKIRHWLAKSRATQGGSPAPSNYFGSFVGALVDRRISQADHQIDFVSQWFRVTPHD
jgi:hypothetical protein